MIIGDCLVIRCYHVYSELTQAMAEEEKEMRTTEADHERQSLCIGILSISDIIDCYLRNSN